MDHLRITSETLMYQGVIRVIRLIRPFCVFFKKAIATGTPNSDRFLFSVRMSDP
jgi:hypothetical protein